MRFGVCVFKVRGVLWLLYAKPCVYIACPSVYETKTANHANGALGSVTGTLFRHVRTKAI